MKILIPNSDVSMWTYIWIQIGTKINLLEGKLICGDANIVQQQVG